MTLKRKAKHQIKMKVLELNYWLFFCSFMFISPNMISHNIYSSVGTRQTNVAY